MRKKLSAAVLAAAVLGLAAPAHAAGVEAGVLTCNVDSGWGYVIGSSRALDCTYSSNAGENERYIGHIAKLGVDLGYLSRSTLVWGVVAPTIKLAPGALAGSYGGGTAGVTLGVGVAANALIGGFDKSISLQPLSIEGTNGVDVAAGLASIDLVYQPQPAPQPTAAPQPEPRP